MGKAAPEQVQKDGIAALLARLVLHAHAVQDMPAMLRNHLFELVQERHFPTKPYPVASDWQMISF